MLTLKWLKEEEACKEARLLFREIYGTEVKVTAAFLMRVDRMDGWYNWLLHRFRWATPGCSCGNQTVTSYAHAARIIRRELKK